MFIKTQSGKIVNLSLVGEIGIKHWDYGDGWIVVAKTGTSDSDSPAVYVELFTGTKEQCKEYMAFLWNALLGAECTLTNEVFAATVK